jgi:SNF family Na+-dependent transporter
MGPAGNFIGAIWFFMLFLAAITSSISMYQPSLAFFQESLGISRRRATTLMVSICVFGSFLVMYYSKGGEFRTAIDDWVGTFLIFILAGVQIICFSWVFGIERGWKELHAGANMRVPIVYKFIMKWVAPIYLLLVFIFFCKDNLGTWIGNVAKSPLQQGALALVGGVLLFLLGCVWVGERRWRAQGIDIDDRVPLND